MAEALKQVVKCACGCGSGRPSVDARGRERLFLVGHFGKGKGLGKTKQKCRLSDCDRVEVPRNGMCNIHYRRWKKYGDPNVVPTRGRHGHASKTGGRTTDEYRAWQGMRARCNNPNLKDYPEYGGRGIRVCERWNLFENLLADMGPRPSPQHSVDRFPNNNGNYEPGNCRWATPTEQNRNSRHNRMITIGSVSRPAVEWTELFNISREILLKRIASGRDPATGVRNVA